MKKIKLIVNTPGRMLYINNKPCRTPLSYIGTENEIKKIKGRFIMEGITNYTEEEVEEVSKKLFRNISRENHEQNEKVDIPKTILESFLED